MWTLKKEIEIDSSHFLRNYEGKCANLHGHRWKIVVEMSSDCLSKNGMLVDFNEIKNKIMKYDHKVLNEIQPFDNINPTAELMAEYFCEVLKADKVIIYETPTSSVTYVKSK